MAKQLQNIFSPGIDEIAQTYTIESWHVSQSVDALTGAEAYDITISGSLTTIGPLSATQGFTGSLLGSLSVSTDMPNAISEIGGALEINTANGTYDRDLKLSAWSGTSEVLLTDNAISLDAYETRVEQYLTFPTIGNYINDAAAAAAGVPLNGVYRNGNVLSIRVI